MLRRDAPRPLFVEAVPVGDRPWVLTLRLGLIVNPLAGVGGRLALKGSDDRGLVEAALARGAVPPAGERARTALAALPADVEILAAGGAMGADIAGTPITPAVRASTAADTRAAAIALADAGRRPPALRRRRRNRRRRAGGRRCRAAGDRHPRRREDAFGGLRRHAAARRRAGGGVRRRPRPRRRARRGDGRRRGRPARRRRSRPGCTASCAFPSRAGLVQSGKARSAPSEATAQAAIAAHVVEFVLGDGAAR